MKKQGSCSETSGARGNGQRANTWVFGEEYNLWVNDRSLNAVLKKHKEYLDPDIAIDDDVKIVGQNHEIFSNFGPSSEIARTNPESDAHGIWLSERLPNQTLVEFLRAADGAKFLYGSRVTGYLEELYTNLIYFEEADETYNSLQGNERSEAIQKRVAYLKKIQAFYKEFDPLVEPYVGMRQRRPWF